MRAHARRIQTLATHCGQTAVHAAAACILTPWRLVEWFYLRRRVRRHPGRYPVLPHQGTGHRRVAPLEGTVNSGWLLNPHRPANTPETLVDASLRPLLRALQRRGYLPTWCCSGLVRDHVPALPGRRHRSHAMLTCQCASSEEAARLRALADACALETHLTPGTATWLYRGGRFYPLPDFSHPTYPQVSITHPRRWPWTHDRTLLWRWKALLDAVVRELPRTRPFPASHLHPDFPRPLPSPCYPSPSPGARATQDREGASP